jgi:hypothetical protein
MTQPARYSSQTPATPPSVDGSDERLRLYQAKRDKLNEIDISHIFEALGADPNQDGDSSKWKINNDNIIVKGQGWKNVSTDIHKGYGGVSLVQHAMGFERQRQAMDWIVQKFAGTLDSDDIKHNGDDNTRTQADFEPPDRLDDLLPDVRNYLVNTRAIPPSLVAEAVNAGNLYASRHLDKKSGAYVGAPRCVFLGPASAEIRELGDDGFKGCCTGSQTDHSGFRMPYVKKISENILALQEAAVDSFSYRALFPGRFVFSTNGSGRFNLQYKLAIQAIESEVGLRMALDADWAGDSASQRIFNSLFLRLLLPNKLGVAPEQVDAWLLSEAGPEPEPAAADDGSDVRSQRAALATLPGNSPHELFFNTSWQPELDVHEAELVQMKNGVKRVWTPSGKKAAPAIRLTVLKDVHPKLPRGEMWIPVSERSFKHIAEVLNVRRDRTPWGKDWNDSLRKLGSSYTMAYETAAKRGFANGPPALPYELERLRNPDAKQQQTSTPPASSGRPTGFR